MKRKAFSCSKAEYKREGNKLSIKRKTFGVAEAAQNVIGGAAETAGNIADTKIGGLAGGLATGGAIQSALGIGMGPIGWLIGGVNFSDLKVELPKLVVEGVEVTTAPATINYGNFIQTLLDFTIIAFCVFMLVKGINKLKKKEEEKPAAPAPAPEPSAEEKLLTEIRDLLKNK